MVKKIIQNSFAAVRMMVYLFVCLQLAGIGFLVYKSYPLYITLKNDHLIIKKKLNINIDTAVPVTSAIKTRLDVPIKKRIALNMPIQGKIDVSIDEPFEIPVTSPIQVYMDNCFPVNETIRVQSEFKIDQTVQTKLMGFTRELPIKGEIPVDLSFPFNQEIRIKDGFALTATHPLTCQVTHDLSIPIKLTARTEIFIDQTIPVPVDADIHTNIRLTGDLPCFLYLDIYYDTVLGKFKFDHNIQID